MRPMQSGAALSGGGKRALTRRQYECVAGRPRPPSPSHEAGAKKGRRASMGANCVRSRSMRLGPPALAPWELNPVVDENAVFRPAGTRVWCATNFASSFPLVCEAARLYSRPCVWSGGRLLLSATRAHDVNVPPFVCRALSQARGHRRNSQLRWLGMVRQSASPCAIQGCLQGVLGHGSATPAGRTQRAAHAR